MKTKTGTALWTAVCASALLTTVAFRASAENNAGMTDKQAPKPAYQSELKSYTGIVDSVDAKEHRLVLRNMMFTRAFTLGDSCTYSFLDKNGGSIENLRPGQKVTVNYQDANGVLVTGNVVQQPMRYEGTVRAIDPQQNTLVLNVGALNRDLQLGDDCSVMLHNNKSGALADIKPGHHVSVFYETPNGQPVARQIAQTSDTFEGSLTAIDLNDRTVKAKSMLSSKKFNVAKGCTVVINGRTDAQLRDLKPGDNLVLNYDTVDGVNIVNRIGVGELPADASSSAQTQYQYP